MSYRTMRPTSHIAESASSKVASTSGAVDQTACFTENASPCCRPKSSLVTIMSGYSAWANNPTAGCSDRSRANFLDPHPSVFDTIRPRAISGRLLKSANCGPRRLVDQHIRDRDDPALDGRLLAEGGCERILRVGRHDRAVQHRVEFRHSRRAILGFE